MHRSSAGDKIAVCTQLLLYSEQQTSSEFISTNLTTKNKTLNKHLFKMQLKTAATLWKLRVKKKRDGFTIDKSPCGSVNYFMTR